MVWKGVMKKMTVKRELAKKAGNIRVQEEETSFQESKDETFTHLVGEGHIRVLTAIRHK